MKRNNIIALAGFVLVFTSTDLNAGVTSRVRDFFFGPPKETSTANLANKNAHVEQLRRQLEQDVEMQGPSALRRPAPAQHSTQGYFTPSPAPTYAPQPLSPSQQAAQRGQAPLPPSSHTPAPAHATQAPVYTTQQHSQGPATPSQYAPQTGQTGQPKQSIFGRVTNKVTGILKPKKEEVVIGGPSDFEKRSAKEAFPGGEYQLYKTYKKSGNEAIAAKQAKAKEEAAALAEAQAQEEAARERAIPPRPNKPAPRKPQPVASNNDIPSEQQGSQTPPASAPLVQPVRPSRTTAEGGDISGPTNARPYVPKTAEEIERARVAKAVQEAYDIATREIHIQPIMYEPNPNKPLQPTPQPKRYINVPARQADVEAAKAE